MLLCSKCPTPISTFRTVPIQVQLNIGTQGSHEIP